MFPNSLFKYEWGKPKINIIHDYKFLSINMSLWAVHFCPPMQTTFFPYHKLASLDHPDQMASRHCRAIVTEAAGGYPGREL